MNTKEVITQIRLTALVAQPSSSTSDSDTAGRTRVAFGWDYYPALIEVMATDLHLLGRKDISKDRIERCLHDLDDSDGVITDALKLGNHYNAVSHNDLVQRVLTHITENEDAIPSYPLIVVDEYQDFSLLETSFVQLLATKSKVLIAGDDDQALYAFKNASSRYIRELHADDVHENFDLPYCSRCPQVIVDAVNDVIAAARANGNLEGRIDKPFKCYLPDKHGVSEAHSKIIYAQYTVQSKKAPYPVSTSPNASPRSPSRTSANRRRAATRPCS